MVKAIGCIQSIALTITGGVIKSRGYTKVQLISFWMPLQYYYKAKVALDYGKFKSIVKKEAVWENIYIY